MNRLRLLCVCILYLFDKWTGWTSGQAGGEGNEHSEGGGGGRAMLTDASSVGLDKAF